MAPAPRPHRDFLPLPRHLPLLTALLAPADEARPAALQWLEAADFDAIDTSEQRLMPFFDSRLRELAIDHPVQGRVRGLFRWAWYVEQTMRKELGGILRLLAEAAIPAVLLKGAVLSRVVYAHPAHRPYGDFDILVPHAQQRRAIAALKAAGGFVSHTSFHAITLRMPSGFSVDLHRSPYQTAFCARHVDPLFTRLREVEAIQREQARAQPGEASRLLTLGNADQLLHTIMHGLCPISPPPIRWIVDAVLLLRREREEIDWDLFQAEAARLEFIEPAIVGLREILRHEPDAAAVRVLARLEAQTSPAAIERWCAARRDSGLIAIWDNTRRNAKGPGRALLVIGLVLEQHGPAGLVRAAAGKGMPALRALFRTLRERRKRLAREAQR